MTTTYALLLLGDESYWESDEGRTDGMARHHTFAALLAERGHTITGGAQLTPTRQARTLRGGDGQLGGATLTDGPFAESAEQMTGFYLVTTDDVEGMLECCSVLSGPGHDVEVRPIVERGQA